MKSAPDSGPSRVLAARLDLLEERLASLDRGLTERLDDALTALSFIVDDDGSARRKLAELRASAEYEEAYGDPRPLVSVLMPTWNRIEALTTRAIPSVLAQTYENIEAVVVGDRSPPELREAVAAIGDPRVRFHNLTIQGPYHEDPFRAWCAAGTPPRNAGLALARGRWIAMLDDDDVFPPNHVEVLLDFARARRIEFAYGWLRFLDPDGGTRRIGHFPPKRGYIGLQAALWHSGLRFLEFELAQAEAFATPNDWALIRRMMRVGVSMGQTDELTVDYEPSGRGNVGAPRQLPPDETPQLRRRVIDLEEYSHDLESQYWSLEARLLEAQRQADAARGELARRLEEVRRSRSWQLTAPLRLSAQLRRRLQNRRA